MTLYTHYDLDKHTSRKFRYKEYRHAVRHVLARNYKNYEAVRLMEYAETGKMPHHTTVMHSVEVADPRLVAVVTKTARALRLFR
jgi:hypothetical protein